MQGAAVAQERRARHENGSHIWPPVAHGALMGVTSHVPADRRPSHAPRNARNARQETPTSTHSAAVRRDGGSSSGRGHSSRKKRAAVAEGPCTWQGAQWIPSKRARSHRILERTVTRSRNGSGGSSRWARHIHIARLTRCTRLCTGDERRSLRISVSIGIAAVIRFEASGPVVLRAPKMRSLPTLSPMEPRTPAGCGICAQALQGCVLDGRT